MERFLFILPLMIGTTEIVLLAAAALLLFGGKKLPQMMRNMGKGVKEFKEGIQGAPSEFQTGMNETKEDDSASEGQESPLGKTEQKDIEKQQESE